MGQIINGKEVAFKLKESIKEFVNERREKNLKIPKIASILVGNDGGSIYYMEAQEKVATSLGVEFLKIKINEDASDEEVIKEIHKLNMDNNIQGIILQLPLPSNFDENNKRNKCRKGYRLFDF